MLVSTGTSFKLLACVFFGLERFQCTNMQLACLGRNVCYQSSFWHWWRKQRCSAHAGKEATSRCSSLICVCFCAAKVACVKSRDMHWALVAHRDQRDVNLSSLRMLVVADGANPCKTSQLLRQCGPTLCLVLRKWRINFSLLCLKGQSPPAMPSSMSFSPKAWGQRSYVHAPAPPRPWLWL